MFTGIIEEIGVIKSLVRENDNLHITVKSNFTSELKIDQSVAHNGVCLTVVEINNDEYTVTAINETLQKTTLGSFSKGEKINLERGMQLGERLDGHLVQGHVDQIAVCKSVVEDNGSTIFTFQYDSSLGNVTIEKGSITISGISLTVINSKKDEFSVAIIPYTLDHTILKFVKVASVVNLEFDVIGKYVAKLYSLK